MLKRQNSSDMLPTATKSGGKRKTRANSNEPQYKPLIALLDARDCTVELSILKDVAVVAFCNATTLADIHEQVMTTAVGAFMWHTMHLSKDDLTKFKSLRVIVRMGSGLDNIDIKGAAELGIAVANIPGMSVEEVADSTLSLILNMYRKTNFLTNAVTNGYTGGFEDTRLCASGARRIRGSTLGIIGLGNVGTAVALRAKAFGFNVISFDPFVDDGKELALGIRKMYTLQDLLFESDCISLHCSLNNNNRKMINSYTLRQMRRHSFLVNTSSGGLVDDAALANALMEGQLDGAGIDVHENEPLSIYDGPLCGAPNLIFTSHTSYVSSNSLQELREAAAHEMLRYLNDPNVNSLRNCVNKHFFSSAQLNNAPKVSNKENVATTLRLSPFDLNLF